MKGIQTMSNKGQRKTIDGIEYELNENSRWVRITPRTSVRAGDGDFGVDASELSEELNKEAYGISAEEILGEWSDGSAPKGNKVDYEDALEGHEERIAKLREELDDLKENGTPEEILEYAYNLSHSQEYQDLVYTKELGRRERDEKGDKFSDMRRSLNAAIDSDKVDDWMENNDISEVYEAGQEALLAHEDYKAVGDLLEDHKNLVSEAMYHGFKGRDVSDVISDFTGESMGDSRMIGDYEPGTREWLELRQTGMGGSDIGAMFGSTEKHFDEDGNVINYYSDGKPVQYYDDGTPVKMFYTGGIPAELDEDGNVIDKFDSDGKKLRVSKPKDIVGFKDNPYHSKNLERIWDSKVNEISDEQVAEQAAGQTNFTDAASRGNAQEEIIGEMAARREGFKLLRNKGTWSREGSSANINYDYMMTSDGKTPDGNFEIKTASDPSKWGPESMGLDAVPNNYRAQAIAGCLESGLSRGAVAVLINETDLRVYPFNMTDDLRNEAERNKEMADMAYAKVEEARASGETEFKREHFGLPPKRQWTKPAYGFNSKHLTKGLGGEKAKIFSMVASLRGSSKQDIEDEFVGYMPRNKKEWDAETIEKGLRKVITNGDMTGRKLTGMDIECSSLSPTRGRIIEMGMVTKDMGTGETSDRWSTLHDVPLASKNTVGTGAEDVHHISLSDIAGKPRMDDPKVQASILERMKKDGVVIAHNKSYEDGFCMAQIKGYAEARANGDIQLVDSMQIHKLIHDKAPNAKLQTLVEMTGGAYEGAHRAEKDADMTMEAVSKVLNGKNIEM